MTKFWSQRNAKCNAKCELLTTLLPKNIRCLLLITLLPKNMYLLLITVLPKSVCLLLIALLPKSICSFHCRYYNTHINSLLAEESKVQRGDSMTLTFGSWVRNSLHPSLLSSLTIYNLTFFRWEFLQCLL